MGHLFIDIKTDTMKKNLFSTTFVIFAFSICTTLFPNFFIQKHFPNNLISPNPIVLELTQPTQRFSFSINKKGINKIQLCHLEKDKNYQLYLSEFEKPCNEQVYFLENLEKKTRHLQIKANENCHEILIQNSCDFKQVATLSVHSFSKKKREDSQKNSSAANLIPIITDSSLTVTELVEDVLIGGGCFDVSDVRLIGSAQGVGSFSNGFASLGFENGVVISSGNIADVEGPNQGEATGTDIGSGSDSDLELMTNQTIFNAVGIEFEFSPTVAEAQFNFVFASDEYCEYVNTQFNDVFGFFISGPGINGPYTDNAENIALVPTTTTPITINSVNHLLNSDYFVPNSTGCGSVANSADIEFDGYTVSMTATATVIPCETYQIRLVVADGSDAFYDSAVFLEAGSFSAGGQAGVSTSGATAGSNLVFEDCGDGFLTFTRETGDDSLPLEINYNIATTSTATSGFDYEPLPTTVTIPAGQSEISIPITAFEDNVEEGLESIFIELDNSCSCILSVAEIQITEVKPLLISMEDQVHCGNQNLVLEPEVIGGVAPFSFVWSTGETTSSISSSVTQPTTFSVTITDDCGNVNSEDINITIGEIPTAILSGELNYCAPQFPSGNFQIDFTGSGPWDIHYSINGLPQTPFSQVTDNPFIFPVNQAGTYVITELYSNGCEGTSQGEAIVTATIVESIINQNGNLNLDCINNSIVLDGSASQPNGEISFEWTTSNGNILSGANTPNPEVDQGGIYTLTVTHLAEGCTSNEYIIISEDISIPTVLIKTPNEITCDSSEIILDATDSSFGNNFTYEWTTVDGNFISGENTLTPTVNKGGHYTLEILDTISNCRNESFVTVVSNNAPPNIELAVEGELNCSTTSVIISGEGSSVGNNISYEWITGNGNFITSTNNISTEVDATGNYTLQVTNSENGCSAIDSINVDENETAPTNIIFSLAPPLCHGESGVITVETVEGGTTPYAYSVDGDIFFTNNTFTLSAGDYILYAQDAMGCQTQVDLSIPDPPLFQVVLPDEVKIELGENYGIQTQTTIPIDEIQSIEWTPNQYLSCHDCLNPMVEGLPNSTNFTITITTINGCIINANIIIIVEKERAIYIPNAFSPNGDGENDLFMIFAGNLNQIKQVNQFMVFDRWGEAVFRMDDFMPMNPDFGWDGKFKGEPLGSQVLIYWAEIEFIDGAKIKYKGDVTIVK